MPYIKLKDRAPLDSCIEKLVEHITYCDSEAGALTYILYRLLLGFANFQGINYSCLALCTGILESTKVEFQRQVVAPYEDAKRRENGDVRP